MVIFVGYIVEFIIVYLWYRLILTKELKSKNIVRRSIQVAYAQRRNIIICFFKWKELNKEQKEAYSNIKNCLVVLFMQTYLLIGYIVFGPVLLKCIIDYENNGIYGCVFYLVLLGILIMSRMKDDTQCIVNIINKYIQNIMIPLEKKPELLSVNDVEKPIIKCNIKTVLIVLISSVVVITYVAFFGWVKDSKIFFIITVAWLIAVLLIEKIVSRKKVNIIPESINVDGYILDSVKEDIADMCNQLGIKNLECKVINTQEVYVTSKIPEDGIAQIDISYGFISMIYDYEARDILLITIAHELGHIYYNDFRNIRKRTIIIGVLNILLILLNLLVLIVFVESSILFMILLFVYVIQIIFSKIICDTRYWQQIAELRADRLAINVCRCNKMFFAEFWKQYSKKEKKEETNKVHQFYKRYIKIEGHPSMERRMELIEKREKWSWWEYFEHAVVIFKWRITNKGWNGI